MTLRSGLVLLALLVACARTEVTSGEPPLPGITTPSAALAQRLHAAVVAKGPSYHPHTRHRTPEGAAAYTNRLVLETSPYLLQHAHNPVNWYAWGDEPFARARREGKLVLVSVGYSTCHWCHVMEDESFEDVEVARYVNEHYVCIKVDREERPDVDAVYMDVAVMLTGSGGWPLNVVTDAQRRPVFAGTYLPKPRLLETLRALRAAAPATLAATGAEVVSALARAQGGLGGAMPGGAAIEAGVRALASTFDAEAGGFGRGMKFPRAPELDLLLRYHRRTDDPRALAIVATTLERMAAGGIHDQLGGGFHRYTTDRAWLVPHFEKMLYDNAQLARLYVEVSQLQHSAALADIASATLDYVLREMTSPEGGFYSATDADSPGPEGHRAEGYYFTWTADELTAAVGGDAAAAVRAWFAVGAANALVDGRSVLHAPRALPAVAAELGISPDALAARLRIARPQLLAARARRVAPARDDKILTSWNGLMISALARGGFALDRPRYVDAAERAATFALAQLRSETGGLLRSYRDGQARQVATLTDYACLIQGLLDLFAARTDRRWLVAALALAEQLDTRFGDRDAGGYFMTDRASEPLLVRGKPIDDGAEPSANAIIALDLLRLEELTGDGRWRDRAMQLFAAFAGEVARGGSAAALRGALEAALDEPPEIVIVTPHTRAEAAPLLAAIRPIYLPNHSLVVVTEGAELVELAKLVPMLDGKSALGGKPTAFVCIRTRCRQPTSDPAVLAQQLARVTPLYPDRSPAPLPLR